MLPGARDFLEWPFFTPEHRDLFERVSAWATQHLAGHTSAEDRASVEAECRHLVRALGHAGWTRYSAPMKSDGEPAAFDVRALTLIRETLAWHEGLADFAFAMQGLGTGSISLYGTPELKARYLPRVRDGRAIAAFALSEPEAGSDVAAMATTTVPDGNAYVRINGL